MMGDLGWLGEISTELTGAADVHPEPGTYYDLDMVVLKDLPLIIDTVEFQLEGFAFHAGRIQPDAGLSWETNASWATIDEDGLLELSSSGELEIKLSLESDTSINCFASCLVELPSRIPELSNSRILAMPNPSSNYFKLTGVDEALVQVFSSSGILRIEVSNYNEGQSISTETLNSGFYVVRITSQDYTGVVKLIKQ
jgi:hypothetical protein